MIQINSTTAVPFSIWKRLKAWRWVIIVPVLGAFVAALFCHSFLRKTYLFRHEISMARILQGSGTVEYPDRAVLEDFLRARFGKFAGNLKPALIYLEPSTLGYVVEVEASDRASDESYVQTLLSDLELAFHSKDLVRLSKDKLSKFRETLESLKDVSKSGASISPIANYLVASQTLYLDEKSFQDLVNKVRPFSTQFLEQSKGAHYPPTRAVVVSVFFILFFISFGFESFRR